MPIKRSPHKIPDDRRLDPCGECRLCFVVVKGVPRPVSSCPTLTAEGMEITTSSQQLVDLGKLTLELILSDHPNDCMTCEKTGA